MNVVRVTVQEADVEDLCRLWNAGVAAESEMYRAMSPQEFAERLQGLRDVPADLLVVAQDSGVLLGYALGCTQGLVGPTCADLAALVVPPEARGRATGARLLERFEAEAAGAGCEKVRLSPASNVRLAWGVDPAAFGYPYLWQRGYSVYQTHLYMRRDLVGWQVPAPAAQAVDRLRREGVQLRLARHPESRSLARCAKDVGHDAVADVFQENARRPTPHPVLVAVERGRVIGFVGPLTVTGCGIPEFQMIAVAKSARRRGIGNALFSLSVQHFAERGATVMELMTDTDNPAQRIYFQAGFTDQTFFACFEKDLTAGSRTR